MTHTMSTGLATPEEAEVDSVQEEAGEMTEEAVRVKVKPQAGRYSAHTATTCRRLSDSRSTRITSRQSAGGGT